MGWCVPANGLCPYQRVATRRYGYLIPFGMMGWLVTSGYTRYGDHIPAGMIGVSGNRRGVSSVIVLLGGESVYLYIYGGKIGGAHSF